MRLEQAQSLIATLGSELGGQDGRYTMDEHGEVQLLLDENLPVMIRHVEPVLVLAAIVAQDVDDTDPSLFATLMDYQFMGLRTNGFNLSWNASTACLQLSSHLRGEPDVKTLADELSTLLATAVEVRDELATLLDYQRSLLAALGDEDEAAAPLAAGSAAVMPPIRG